MATRGIQVLREKGIAHEVLTYRFDRKGARLAADALGLLHAEVLKSLVFRADDGSFLFALIAGDGNVSVRKLGRVTGHKHVDAAAPHDAERVTGYQTGGISPFGSRQALQVILDATAASRPSLVINAGARGTLVRLATSDLIVATGAEVADIRIESDRPPGTTIADTRIESDRHDRTIADIRIESDRHDRAIANIRVD
jgi:Cys-tRNA(Pro)/Cys-tRNA(Cys) deacylase